jgi:hypothetical protein
MRSILRDAIYRKHKECNCTIRFIPESAMERIPFFFPSELRKCEISMNISYIYTV